MATVTVPRHEAWRMAYRQDRYCEKLTLDELKRRIRDIFLTLWTLTPEANVGMLPMDAHGLRWMELWTHALEELNLRGRGLTEDILHREPLPDFVGPLAKRAAASLAKVPAAGCLLKFGKPDFMRSMYEQGTIRIQPASFYKQPNLNGAVRDDELAIEAIVRLDHFPDEASSIPDGQVCVDVRFEHKADYWLYCLSSTVAPRHFVDFEAESCVVITKPTRFIHAVGAAFAKAKPTVELWHGKVTYIDPLQLRSLEVNVPRAKHFRYWYQREYRLVWSPPKEFGALEYVDLHIGPMHEYATLIQVGQTEA